MLNDLRQIVTLQRATITNDATTNQPIETWASLVADVPCSIETVSGGEVRRGRQMEALTTLLVRMHHLQDAATITTKDRIDWSGRTLNIVAAYDPTGLRRELEIQCREDV